ncbi:ABC transporter permease [Zavarzinia compransoris]|uniref:ABC transporter permease n=1 Tax=Zavarzinia compransoris TaxID=1264899 RepID=A0A317ECW8_9PROT|nr:ABC transporter permease [Zavarzinia compransoris]PWR23203.1 ABC transporter permease [Zavarzinia compransoris]TDP46237.1 spermidine/putrescine transport system permease protein [Zavarzinia compransoris]
MIDYFRRRPAARRAALVSPAVGAILLFMVLPLGLMLIYSFLQRATYGGVIWEVSFESYIQFLFERDLDDSLIFNAAYLQIYARSFGLAAITTVLCVIIGFPTALYLVQQSPKRRNILMFLVTIPFWTNLLVRTYAWILLLRREGLVDYGLEAVGVTDEPLGLLYTDVANLIGLVYSFLPFMVLPIYSSLEKLDFRLVEAAYDLGANRLTALRRIVIPLAMPGIAAGCILVLVPCLGAYVTPELLGGGKALMIGNLIQQQFGASQNWPFGAALSFALLAIVLIALVAYSLRFGRGALTEGR